MEAWNPARSSCSLAGSSRSAWPSRSAPRVSGFRRSSRSSRSACCSARTGRAESTSTTPSSRGRSGSSGLAAILYEGGLSTSWRRLRRVAVPAACSATVGSRRRPRCLTGRRGVHAVRPLVARVGAARRRSSRRPTRPRSSRRCGSRTSGGGSRARWRPRRAERPDGDRADDRPDRLDRAIRRSASRTSCSTSFARSASASSSASCSALAAMWVFARLPQSIGAFAPVASVAAAALSFGIGGRDRRQRVPRRLSRRPRGRQHAVALPPPARRVPRRARVPRAGGDVRRARAARLPERPAGGGARRACVAALLIVRDPTRRGLGLDRVQRLHQPRARAARLGRPARCGADRARRRSCCRPRSASERRSSTRSSSSSSSPRWCRARRSSGWRGARAVVTGAGRRHAAARGRRLSAHSSSWSSPSQATTRSPVRRCASSASRAPRSSRSSRAATRRSRREAARSIEPGDRLFVLVPHGSRADLEDVFARWRRRV